MIIPISGEHPIFQTAEYQRDLVTYNVLDSIRSQAPLLVSDGESFIVCRGSLQYPAWIWTTRGISGEALQELCGYCYQRFCDEHRIMFVARPSVTKPLAKRFVEGKSAAVRVISMESFECKTVIPARNQAVRIERPSAEDVDSLAECCQNFEADCFGELRSPDDFRTKAERIIQNEKCYIIRENGRIAAMAMQSRETETHIAIDEVYTRTECRNRGYASAIVAHIAEQILKSGKLPCLYTDLSNPASNGAYKSVGFVECGRLDEITIQW